MKIEKYKKIKEDLYRVLLDNGEIIDIYEDVILANNLLYKSEIDQNLLDKINIENNYQLAYNISVKYIMVRLRSINEIKVYLTKKGYSKDVVDKVIEKLIKNKLLDDEIFTKAYINDKLNFTNVGKYKLISELTTKMKVDNSIVYNVLESYKEVWNDRIEKLINKYLKSNKKYRGNTLKDKLYIYLVNLGYDKDKVISVLNNYDF
ncbi:MAG: RecX family transcriptional regulator [Bacilli bacterium]|nr:RecX family transcriptional regulator [Bacilli bacterium]